MVKTQGIFAYQFVYRREKLYDPKTFVWYFGAYMLIFQFRQKYLVVNFTPDSTGSQKICKGVFFFFDMWLVISCVYGGNSQLKLDISLTSCAPKGSIPLLLFSCSSNKWILLCLKLLVTAVPKKPTDVSFVGEEDVHIEPQRL